MKYWEDLNNGFGFGDGACCPDGIELYRTVYIKTVNSIAEKYGYKWRVAPYDQPGSHNGCMVVIVTKKWFEECFLPAQPGESPIYLEVNIPDEEHLEKESVKTELAECFFEILAFENRPDSFVWIDAKLDPTFSAFLEEIKQP